MVEINRGVSALGPDYISVTCSAGGSGNARTAEIAALVRSCGVEPLAHVTCINSDREAVSATLREDEIRWGVDVNNRTADKVIREVHFPIFTIRDPEPPMAAITSELVSERIENLPRHIRSCFTSYMAPDQKYIRTAPAIYPGRSCSMNCFELDWGGDGFYFGCHDSSFELTAHLFELVADYGTWIYAILFVIVFCETGLVVTPFLPGDSLLFASGVVAGAGLMGYEHVLLTLLAAGVLGDACNYFIGRHVGPAIFARETRFIKKEHLLKANQFYEKHGGKAIILARFIPIVRTIAPFVAGIALMCPRMFFLFNVTGCILWVGGLVSAGYFLGNQPWVRENFGIIVYAIIVISVLPVAIELIRARMGRKKS